MSVFAAALFSAATPAIAQDATVMVNDSVVIELVADSRRCARPFCGGYMYREVGQDYTICGDGISRRACYAATVDFSLTPFDEYELDQVLVLALDQVLDLRVVVDSVQVVGHHAAQLDRLRVVDVHLNQGPVN